MKKILTYLGIVVLFLVLAYGFVPQVLDGKIVNQSDISGWQGMAHEMLAWNQNHPDNETQWTESMFGGMPTATIHPSTKGDWTQPLYDLLLTGKRPATYLFISLLGAFLMMLAFGVSPLVAVGAAIAVTFCSYNLQIIQVGHNSKMQALAFLPWVLAAVVFTYRASQREEKWLQYTALGAALFGVAMSFQVKANHPQISYYLAIMILVLVAVILVSLLLGHKPLKRFFIASALLLVLGVAGIATNAIKLLPTMEYTPYSMRGGSSDGSTKGLEMSYATAWSYGWEELPNLAIPNYNGGSSAGAVNPEKSETCKLLKRAGQTNVREVAKQLPLYWGPQPFTAGPMYLGAVTVFLFLFGMLYYKGKEKWWVVIVSIIAIFLGLGSHFQWFTTLFYKFVPLYNKFRTVSMALVVLQFTLPILGFLMLDRILKSTEDRKALSKQVLQAGGLTVGLLLVLALFQSISGTFRGAADAGMENVLSDALAVDRKTLLWNDSWRSIILAVCAAAAILWGIRSKSGVKAPVCAGLVAVLVVIDLFPVGKRYLSGEDFITPKNFSGQFDKRPVDEMILEDTDPSYRVLDLSVDVFNDSHPSYWHKNIGGYSPAKLQLYQEYIDKHLASEINSIYKALGSVATIQEAQDALPYCPGLSALNCRYIILGPNNAPLVNTYARGEAWFEEEEAGSIAMKSYAPNKMVYEYSSSEGGRAVFSEVYYPDGWKLTLEDGSAIDIYLTDEVLRGAVLPAGDHVLTMSYEPTSYSRGEAISRASSILLLLLVLGSVAGMFYTSALPRRPKLKP